VRASSPGHGRRVVRSPRHLFIALVAALALAMSASIALAQSWGPWSVTIASSGGWVACGPTAPDAANYAFGGSVQGTRHPYRGAIYDAGGNVLNITGQISTDAYFALGEGSGNFKTLRIDNQASTSGNGQYSCYFST